MKRQIILLVLASGLLLNSSAFATQGGSGHYTPGMFTDFSGTVPTEPGWVFANYYLNYHDATYSASKGLPFGGILGLNVTANSSADVPVVMYAYPVDFLGGTLASGVSIPFSWVRVKAGATINSQGQTINVTKQQSASGLGDIQLMPIMAGWTNGDFKFDFYMHIWAPTGDYNKDDLANTGLGYWTFTPMLGASWLSSKLGTEATVFAGVDFNTENTDANYTSGNIFHVDGTVAQHLPLFGGLAGVGASAFYLKQFTGDSGSGAKLGDFEVETYGVGPTVSYMRQVGRAKMILDGSWLPQLHSVNSIKGDFFWVKATLVF